jgi:DNA-binding winged helix-turn-helix (wHTH) protein/lipoprotein NlpI
MHAFRGRYGMTSRIVVFGDLHFDMSTRELVRVEHGGATTPVPLGSRAADMLALFLQRPGDLVAKNEIMNTVWPNTTIEDSNLTVQISALRRALDAGREGGSAIATVPGRGYRFTLPVQEDAAGEAPAPTQTAGDAVATAARAPSAVADVPAGPASGRRRVPTWAALAGGGLLVALVALGLHWGGFLPGGGDPKAARLTVAALHDRGVASIRKERFDDAIADFSEVIKQDPWHSDSYLWRARARRSKGDYDGAIADGAKAVELTPESHLGYLERAFAYLTKGDFDPAIADFGATLRISRNNGYAIFGRGRAYYFAGELAKARVDFLTFGSLSPTFFEPAFWLRLIRQRSNVPGDVDAVERRLNMAVWPAPILRMLAGEITPAQALAAADDKDAATKRRQVCQVNYYGGELALAQGTRDDAARLFRLAADGCPWTTIEQPSAIIELRLLEARR